MDSVCIVDFCGNARQSGFWADYFPGDAKTYFGGAWASVPPMPCDVEPTEGQVDAWVAKTDPQWYELALPRAIVCENAREAGIDLEAIEDFEAWLQTGVEKLQAESATTK